MANTTPNLETIRRICLLKNIEYCYILIDTGDEFVYLMVDLEDKKIELFTQELESWCGMKFKVFNDERDKEISIRISSKGKKIYPL